MADTYEKDLGQKSSLTTSDFIRVVGSDNVSYKQAVSSVADTVIDYSAKVLPSTITDLNTIDKTSTYLIGATVPDNAPRTTGAWAALVQTKAVANYRLQTYVYAANTETEVYWRRYTNGTWGSWIKQPTRAEIDALTSSIKVTITAAENVVIDTDHSYKVGRTLFLNVKGHTTAAISNNLLFTITGATVSPVNYTFGVPTGGAWNVDSISYGYVSTNGNVLGTIANGKYFHISKAIECNL